MLVVGLCTPVDVETTGEFRTASLTGSKAGMAFGWKAMNEWQRLIKCIWFRACIAFNEHIYATIPFLSQGGVDNAASHRSLENGLGHFLRQAAAVVVFDHTPHLSSNLNVSSNELFCISHDLHRATCVFSLKIHHLVVVFHAIEKRSVRVCWRCHTRTYASEHISSSWLAASRRIVFFPVLRRDIGASNLWVTCRRKIYRALIR